MILKISQSLRSFEMTLFLLQVSISIYSIAGYPVLVCALQVFKKTLYSFFHGV